MLGLYPEVQAKAAEEVDHLVEMEGADISDLTVENLKSLKYLECVLKEVQRIYPTAPFIGRELSEDTKISKCCGVTHKKMFFNVINVMKQLYTV